MQSLLHVAREIAASLGILLWLSSPGFAQDVKQPARDAKVSSDLYAVLANRGLPNQAPVNGLQPLNLFATRDNTIAIEAAATSEQEGESLLRALQNLGLQDGMAYKQKVSGYLPIDRLSDLKNIPSLKFAQPAYKPKHNVGSVTSQGDVALRANVARSAYGVTGAGVKVGILSDSYNALGGAPAGVASGDLPADVQVLSDLTSGTDEGRAMAELVHDIAPGSPIAFHTAYNTQLLFAQGIRNLAAAGCKIITDDISYFAEPFFQDGVVAQAVDDVVTNQGVTYFSAAANAGRSSYQNTFKPIPFFDPQYDPSSSYTAHDFGGGNFRQRISVPGRGGQVIISFQWDDPFYSVSGGAGAQTDMDILVYSGTTLLGSLSGLSANAGNDAVEVIGLVNNGASAATINLVLVKYSGPDPTLLKWVNYGSTVAIEFDTKSSTVVGHANATRAIAVGAAPFYNTPAFNGGLTTATIEPFSSAGGTPILFNIAGQHISQLVRQKPEITAVDGTNTTFFTVDSPRDADTFPNFFGTSAAAPHAAAVAALMKEKEGSLSSSAILSALQQTALDMDDPVTPEFDYGFDFGTGYGFIQADKALQAISTSASDFAIAGVTTITCTTVSAGQRTLTFNPQYSGINGQTISFSVVSELSPTTNPGPYTLNLYTDNPIITLKATQNGTAGEASFTYNWLAACGSNSTTNPPGNFSIIGVTTITCTVVTPTQRTLTFNPQYAGLTGQPVSFSVTSELSPTTNPGPYTLNLYTDNPTITLKATQAGTAGEASFTYNWLSACGTTTPTPTPSDFAIAGVTTIACTAVTPTQRALTFNPNYSGVNGQSISFSVANELSPTTNPAPYTLNLYIDNPTIMLKATQTGTAGEASFTYNWLAACNTGSGRLSAEIGTGLQVRVLGNPVGETAAVEITGTAGTVIRMTLTDVQGRILHQHQIDQPNATERVHIPVSGGKGLFFLQVGANNEQRQIKLLKQ